MEEKLNIYKELKRRIVFLDYEPGQMIREKELIEEFGVSRTPVREALIRLEFEGLVRIFPNLGTIVSEVSFQQLKNIIEIRQYLIRLTGQLAAARITEEELKQMEDVLERMQKEQSPRELMSLDSEMHDLINQSTKNEMLVKMLEMLRDQAVRIWAFSPINNGYYRHIVDEFEELLAALRQRDEEKCSSLLEKHTGRFVEHIRGQLS